MGDEPWFTVRQVADGVNEGLMTVMQLAQLARTAGPAKFKNPPGVGIGGSKADMPLSELTKLLNEPLNERPLLTLKASGPGVEYLLSNGVKRPDGASSEETP